VHKNVLKNCNNSCSDHNYLFLGNKTFLLCLLLFLCIDVSAAEHSANSPGVINTSDYFKVVLGLISVIALFLLSTFLFKRFGNPSMTGRGQLRLIDGLHLGNRERLVLVELKDKQILLSITPGQINKLDTIDITSSTETTNA
jgi:flagellar protein FliO/FliZ